MPVRVGEIAYVKTTEEPVFVLDGITTSGEFIVRRPVIGQDGIRHEEDSFLPEELETTSERNARIVADAEEREKLIFERRSASKVQADLADLALSNTSKN